MRKLHRNQKNLLNLLRETKDNPLTMIELMEHLNVKSTSVVHHHIIQLEKKGFLKRNPSNSRDYQIVSDGENLISYINLYGLAECGADGSILDGNPIDRIPIASRLIRFPAEEAFLVVARGKSMLPYINQGDYIISQINTSPNNGDIVVCINQSKAIIKKYNADNNQNIILHSTNPDFEPFFASKDFRVEGVVKNIIKNI